MPEPTNLQFDGRLTQIANQYSNPELIGEFVCPPTPVPKKTFTFFKYDKDSRFTVPDTKVGPKGLPGEVEWKTTKQTATCEDHALQEFVSQEEIDNADAPISAEADTTEFVTNLVALAKEKRIATEVYRTANYATYLDLNGSWATITNDILAQILTAMDACFMPPNIMVMGLPTWRVVSRNTYLLAATKGTLSPQMLRSGGLNAPRVNQQELAEFLGLDAVLVGRAKINSAVEGQTATYVPVWDGTTATKGGAALLRVKKGSALKDAVWGGLFHWKERQVLTAETSRGAFGGRDIRVAESNIFASISTDLGYLFVDALLT